MGAGVIPPGVLGTPQWEPVAAFCKTGMMLYCLGKKMKLLPWS